MAEYGYSHTRIIHFFNILDRKNKLYMIYIVYVLRFFMLSLAVDSLLMKGAS